MYTFDQTYLNPQTDVPMIKRSKTFQETIFELNREIDESIYFNHHYTALRKLNVEKPISQTTIPFLMDREFLFSYFEEKIITKEADKETMTQILGHIKQFSSSHDLTFIRNFLDNIKTYAEIIGIKNTSDVLVPALAKVVDEPLNVKIKFLENLLPFIDYLCSNGDEGINILKNSMINIIQELYSQKKENYTEQMKRYLFKNFVKIAKNILPYDTNQTILYIIIGFGNEDNIRNNMKKNKEEEAKNLKMEEHKILCIRYIRNLAEGLGKDNTERYLLPQLISFTCEKNDDIKKELLITLPVIAELISLEFISTKVYDILRRISVDLNPNLRKVCVIATAKIIKIFKSKCQDLKNLNKDNKKNYTAKNFVNLLEKLSKDKDTNVKYKIIEKIGEIIAPLDKEELSLELFEFYADLSKQYYNEKKKKHPLGAQLQENDNPLLNKLKFPTPYTEGGKYSYLNDEDSTDFNEVNSMENDYNRQITEKDLSYYFAYNFPAILFCYGKKYWPELKDIYYDFCFEEDLAIRLSIISSFHEIANIVGKEMTQNELLPIYDKFLESNENYEQKLAIKNLPQILINVDKTIKERYYKYFEPVSIFIDNTGNKVRHFNFMNWKNKLNVIEGILCYYNLYDNNIIYNSILPQCITFSLDKYYKVRKTSAKVLASLLLYLYQQDYKRDKLIQTIKNFAFHKKFKIRINFIKFLPIFLQDKDFYEKEIKNIIKIIILKDKILDIRIALAKVLKKIITNEKEILYEDEDLHKFCFALNKDKIINKLFDGIKILNNKELENNIEDKKYFVEDNKYFLEEFKIEFEKKENNTEPNQINKINENDGNKYEEQKKEDKNEIKDDINVENKQEEKKVEQKGEQKEEKNEIKNEVNKEEPKEEGKVDEKEIKEEVKEEVKEENKEEEKEEKKEEKKEETKEETKGELKKEEKKEEEKVETKEERKEERKEENKDDQKNEEKEQLKEKEEIKEEVKEEVKEENKEEQKVEVNEENKEEQKEEIKEESKEEQKKESQQNEEKNMDNKEKDQEDNNPEKKEGDENKEASVNKEEEKDKEENETKENTEQKDEKDINESKPDEGS